jgi:hypothetical protein
MKSLHALMALAMANAASIVADYRAEAPEGCDPQNATLSATEISADILDAFTTETPVLMAMSTDLSSARAVKNSQIIAHIAVLPTATTYDATYGFLGPGGNATAASALLQDVPVTMNNQPVIPTQVTYLSQIASQIDLYKEAVRYPAYVAGKYIIDNVLTFINGAGGLNFSNKLIQSLANTDLGTVEAVRSQLNTQKALPVGRFGIASTAFSQSLQDDQRMMNSLFYGQKNGGNALRTFRQVAGCENIFEYPDFPGNGINLSAIFADRRAFTVATRIPDMSAFGGKAPDLPQIARWEVVEAPVGGMSLLTVAWISPNTFNINYATTFLFGVSAGNQGGAAGNATDNAAVYITTQ